jgi:hypothetical protein
MSFSHLSNPFNYPPIAKENLEFSGILVYPFLLVIGLSHPYSIVFL